MRVFFIITFLLFFLNNCSTLIRIDSYEIGYDDNNKEYVAYINGNFRDCKKIKTILVKGQKSIFERDYSGDLGSLIINIPLNNIDTGLINLDIYCDNVKTDKSIELWNFSFPLLRYVFTDSFSTDKLNEISQHLIESDLFIAELKTFSEYKDDFFIKASKIFPYLPPKDRQKILIDLAKKYNSKEAYRVFYEYLSDNLFDPASLEIAEVLFLKNDIEVSSNVFNIIMTRPEERIYDKFFNFFLKNDFLKELTIEHVKNDPENSFSKKVIVYVKNSIREGKLRKDYFIDSVADNYFRYNQREIDFYIELLKNERSQDGIALLEKNDIDYYLSEELLKNWEYYNLHTKRYLLDKFETIDINSELFVSKVSLEEDLYFAPYLTKRLHKLKTPYSLAIKEYVKTLVRKGYVDGYIISYLRDIDDIDTKKEYLKKVYEITLEFDELLAIKEVDEEYFINKMEFFFKNTKGDDYYRAVEELVTYGDKYFDLITKDYLNRKDIDNNKLLLAMSKGQGKWGWFVYEELMKRPYNEAYDQIYSNVVINADEKLRNKIIKDLNNLDINRFIKITRGVESARYKIDCRVVLNELLKIRKDLEEIKRIIWMWVYCCPNDYIDFFNYINGLGNEELTATAMEGVVDIINILKINILNEIREPLKEAYNKYDSGLIREQYFDALQQVGTEKDLEELEKLLTEIKDEEERIKLNDILYFLRERLGILEVQ